MGISQPLFSNNAIPASLKSLLCLQGVLVQKMGVILWLI